MKLSDRDILAALDRGDIRMEPRPGPDRVRGASVDLKLGNGFRVFSADSGSHIAHIDLSGPRDAIQKSIEESMSQEIVLRPDETFYLHPGQLALGVTEESITLADTICGAINGRSSLARLGLMVHATAHFVDPGWSGQIVLEFFNCGRYPLGLKPGMTVCSINFEPLSSPALHPYAKREGAKYKHQTGAVASRLAEDRPHGRA
jgi:dCTP deaminase